MTAVDGSAGQPSFRIRGVGIAEFQAGFDGPVGVHVDEVYLFKPFVNSLGVFDVKRVEVLKGPQGTTFGRNTTAGAVNYYSNTPTRHFEAGLTATYGRYDRLNTEGYVSGPLSDTLAARIAVQRIDNRSGPYFNLFNNQRLGSYSQTQARGMLEYNHADTMVRLTVDYGKGKGDLVPYDNLYQAVPGGPAVVDKSIRDPIGRYVVNQDYFQTTDTRRYGGNLRIEQRTPLGLLTSISSYRNHKRENREDSDNTPNQTLNIDWNTLSHTFTQEVRLNGDVGKLNYLVGAYYEHDFLNAVENINSADLLGFNAAKDYIVKDNTWAVFTNDEYALTDRLHFQFGARYTQEKQALSGQTFQWASNLGPFPFHRVPQQYRDLILQLAGKRDDSAFNYKLGLNYQLNPDFLVYGSWSTGYRSGGFDVDWGGLISGGTVSFAPENTKAAEIGVKSKWLDGQITFNAALFHMDIEGYQDTVNQPADFVPRRRNAGTLRSQGVEGEFIWRPMQGLSFNLNGAYVDAKIVKSDLNIGTIPLQGKEAVNSPKVSLGALVDYTVPISDRLEINALLNGKWQSARFLRPDNEPSSRVPSYGTLDATLSLQAPGGRWRVSVWGKNITDTRYLQYINILDNLKDFLVVTADPATYGVTVAFKL